MDIYKKISKIPFPFILLSTFNTCQTKI